MSVAGLGKRFGAKQVLRDVTFELLAGTSCALVGPNGSGKSTLLRILAGVVAPDAGRATVCEREPGRGWAGFLPAGDRALYWRLTGRQNIRFFARLRGLSRRQIDGRVEALRDALNLAEVLGKRVGTCSTGERRRLAIASAFATAAPVMLLDEPLAGLDHETAERLDRLTAHWAAEGGVVLSAAPEPEATPRHGMLLRLRDGDVDP